MFALTLILLTESQVRETVVAQRSEAPAQRHGVAAPLSRLGHEAGAQALCIVRSSGLRRFTS